MFLFSVPCLILVYVLSNFVCSFSIYGLECFFSIFVYSIWIPFIFPKLSSFIPWSFLMYELYIFAYRLAIPCLFLILSSHYPSIPCISHFYTLFLSPNRLNIPMIFPLNPLCIPAPFLAYYPPFLVYSLSIPFLSAQVTFSFFAHSNEESILNTIKQGSFFLSLKGPLLYSCIQS